MMRSFEVEDVLLFLAANANASHGNGGFRSSSAEKNKIIIASADRCHTTFYQPNNEDSGTFQHK